MTAQEQAEVTSLCQPILDCQRKRCTADQENRTFGSIKTKTLWGKELKRAFASQGVRAMLPKYVRLLKHENLTWNVPACRKVVNGYRGG